MRSVMSSTRMMRPTATKLRVTSGAMAILAMRSLAVGQHQPELVERVRAMLVAHAVEPGDKLRRQDSGDRLTQNLGARLLVHALHLRVPALDAVVEVDGEDADVDRFDDVLVELLEAFELRDLLLQPAVELRVLNGDADVAGQRLQQLHVFAGEEVAVIGAAQANDGDGARAAALAIGDAAGKVVVQVEPSGAVALRLGQTKDLLRIFEEDVVVRARPVEVEEANIERAQIRGLQIRQTVRGRQIEVPSSPGRPSPSDARKTATRVTSSVCGSRSTMESSRARRSVCELRPRPNSTSVSR